MQNTNEQVMSQVFVDDESMQTPFQCCFKRIVRIPKFYTTHLDMGAKVILLGRTTIVALQNSSFLFHSL